MPDEQWTRINELISRLEGMPNNQLLEEMEHLSEKGESSKVLKYLRLNFALPISPWNVSLGQCVGGKYTLIEKVASGGMGVIYRAKQELIDRMVAIKMIHPALASELMFARLKEEISTLGLLDHPGIVRIYDADVHKVDSKSQREAVFYTMELVDGPTLRVWMKQKNPSLDEAMKFFAQVCDAVDHAHNVGVIHRDLKPENILVRKNGSPAVLDFGLSKVNATARKNASMQDEKLPSSTDFSGTPAYMSPEIWAGSSDDARGDLYALGVILHELIWGERPLEFDSCDSFKEMQEIAQDWSFGGVPMNGGLLVDEQLIKVTNRMLKKNPDDRPQRAGEVAEVINEYLNKVERRKKLKQRLPYLIGFCVLSLVFFVGWIHAMAQQRAMDQSQQAFNEARDFLRDGAPYVSKEVLSRIPKTAQERHSETAWKQLAVEALTSWGIESSTVQLQGLEKVLSIAPNGDRYFGIDTDGGFALVHNGEVTSFIRADFEPEGISIHPHKPIVVLGDEAGELYILSSEKGLETMWSEKVIHPETMEFSPDGRRFVCATKPSEEEMFSSHGPNSELLLFDTNIWKLLPIHFGANEESEEPNVRLNLTRSITGLAFNHDSTRIATWSSVNSGKVSVWNALTGKLEEAAFVGGGVLTAIWDSSSDQILCVRNDGRCSTWDFRQWQGYIKRMPLKNAGQIQNFYDSQISSLGWLPGNAGFVWHEKGMNRVNLKRPDRIQPLELEAFIEGSRIHWNAAKSAWFSVDQNSVHWWSLHENAHRSLSFSMQESPSVAFVAHAQLLAVSDTSGASLLDSESLEMLGQFGIPLAGQTLSPPFGEDLWLYTKWEGPVRWSVSPEVSGNCIELRKRFSFQSGSAGLMAISDVSEFIAASVGRFISIRSLINDKPAYSVELPTTPQSLSIHPDGKWMAAASVNDGWMRLWQKNDESWSPVNQSIELGVPFFSRWKSHELLLLTRDRLISSSLKQPIQIKTLLDSVGDVTAKAECTHRPFLALAKAGVILILNIENHFESELELPVDMQIGEVIRSVQFNPDGSRLAAIVDGPNADTLHIWDLESFAKTFHELSLGFRNWVNIEDSRIEEVECIDLELGIWNRFK